MPSVFDGLAQDATQQQIADRLIGIDGTNPLQTADYSGPLQPLDHGGVTLASGVEALIVPVNAGRVYLELRHAGADGTGLVWLGFGATAAANTGLFLKPGEGYYGPVGGAVRGLYVGSGSVVVAWQGWGA